MVVKKEVVIKSFFFLQREYWSGCAYIHCIGSSWFRAECVCQRIGEGLWASGLYTIVVEKPLVISWSIDNLFRCGWKHSSRISYHGSMLLDIHLLSHERRACKRFWPRAMMDEPWNARHAKCFDHASWWMSHECRACRIFWPCAMHGIFNYPLLVKLQQKRDFRGHSWNMHLCLLMWAILSFL